MAARDLFFGQWWPQSGAIERALQDAFKRRLLETEPRVNADDAAELNLALFGAFKAWAEAAGWNVDKWSIGDTGQLKTPLGDEVSPYDAAMSLQRLDDMKTMDPAEVVKCFYINPNGEPTLPCELRKDGQATIVIWALWDGQRRLGAAREEMPATPSILVGIEGYGAEEAEWKDPVKVYALMEYGFKLCAFTATTDPRLGDECEEDGDMPF